MLYPIQKSENFLIVIQNDKNPVKGSLRFNFMFPVPEQMVTRKNINCEPSLAYKYLLLKEFKYINSKADEIVKQAQNVYNKITQKACSKNLLTYSCDFKFLEEKCIEFCKEHNLSIPNAEVSDLHSDSMRQVVEKEKTPFNDLLVKIHHEAEIEKKQQEKHRDKDQER